MGNKREVLVMLRNRSKAVPSNSKQAMILDQTSKSPPKPDNYSQTSPVLQSIFGSPNFKAFTLSKSLYEKPEPLLMSPTSILDTVNNKPLISPFKNPFRCDANQPKSPKILSEKKLSWDNFDSKGITVALLDDTFCEETKIPSPRQHNKRMVLSNLRVQIPPSTNFLVSPESPNDFGTKTKFSFSVCEAANCGKQSKDSPNKTSVVLSRCLSIAEMELSEDYTCVICHGPNPRTTHIFDNCILGNFCCVSEISSGSDYAPISKNFLSFCYTCKKNLQENHDIYIYRGEKAFCSEECRYKEMLVDEIEN